MGSVVSSAANGLGTFVGNAVSAPFRALFGASCEGVCSGTFDLPCFIEHICISSLVRLFAVLAVSYAVLFVVFLLVKIGVVKCVAKNAFKMVWKPFWACCRALGGACGDLCDKVRDTERVYRGRRRRRRDVELGELSVTSITDDMASSSPSSSSYSDEDGDHRRGVAASSSSKSRGKPSTSSVGDRRKDRIRQSLRLKRTNSKVERAARLSHGSGQRRRLSSRPRGTEAPSSSMSSSRRVHGGSPPARGQGRHSHVHRRSSI
ncbi:hypothetical protein HU200_041249 [Digitaria exilis]|uniref:Uncharacterized protein n=1 Tax=Digitaria exilis TaxID=1010633 RepID=A0A835BJQ3_9POAL|nr:hypothetical protein HU200_041249 [Digitaria exilis]CAB3456478.1 unnamed protein product [Digitaria exilis]